MKLEMKNPKEKYKISLEVFNGAFKIVVETSGKDRTKLTEVKVKDEIFFLIEDALKSLAKAPAGKHRSIHIPTFDPSTNQSVCNTIITLAKSDDMTYSFTIENKVAGEMRKFTCPIMLSYGIKFEDNITDRESSEKALSYLINRMGTGMVMHQAITAGSSDLWHQKNTLNNVAAKVGAEVSKPKSFGGNNNWGKNSGGGQSSYKKPAPPQEEVYVPSESASDDDIPF